MAAKEGCIRFGTQPLICCFPDYRKVINAPYTGRSRDPHGLFGRTSVI